MQYAIRTRNRETTIVDVHYDMQVAPLTSTTASCAVGDRVVLRMLKVSDFTLSVAACKLCTK